MSSDPNSKESDALGVQALNIAANDDESWPARSLAFLDGFLGAREIARLIGRRLPASCDLGAWTLGEVHGELQRVQICCGAIHNATFVRATHGGGWFADDAAAVGEALRVRAEELCGGGAREEEPRAAHVVHRTGDRAARVDCGKRKHMYEHEDGSGTRELARDEECVTSRHVLAFGEVGLPRRPVAPAVVGHLQPIGAQGQPRRRVREVVGCDDDAMWQHAYRNEPLVLRGCVDERSPKALEWSAAHLREFAGTHSSRYCQEPFGEYLGRMNASTPDELWEYRMCGEMPKALLSELATPFVLQHAPWRNGFDKAVLWYGRSGVSPLHFDPNHNYMHMLDGQKRLLLVDPADSAYLYADHAASAVGNTPIDPLRVDTEAHPLASRVTLWPVTLTRGDVLFIPSQWWHMVLSVPIVGDTLGAADVRNMAVTCQFDRYAVDPPIVTHFSRLRAELFLNLAQLTVPSPEEEEERRQREGGGAAARPQTLDQLKGSE